MLIGGRRPRREDPPLLTGQALFAGDHAPPAVTPLAVVRSQVPCGRLHSIDLDPVRNRPGVLAAWAAPDLPGLGTLPGYPVGSSQLRHRPVLPAGEVRYAGEAVAVVIAETPEGAADAAVS